jgi:hypothetical protein
MAAIDDERQVILRLVQSKQVSPEEGARLLAALTAPKGVPAAPPPGPSAGDGRLLRLVAEEPGGERVNLTVPLRAVAAVLGFVARWVPEEHRDALQAVNDAINSGFRGEVLKVEEPTGQRVRLWIE